MNVVGVEKSLERRPLVSDRFKHKAQKIALPGNLPDLYRVTVPGGWIYRWSGDTCFIPTGAGRDIPERDCDCERLGVCAVCTMRDRIKHLVAEAKDLRYTLREIRSKEGITLKEAQKLAGNTLLKTRPGNDS